MKNPDNDIPDFLKGFAVNKPDNPYSASLWEGMRRKIAESGERIGKIGDEDKKV